MKTEKEKKQLKPNTRSMLKYKCSFGEMKKKTTSLIHSSTSLDVIYCFSFSIFFSHSTFSRAGRYMSTLNPAPVYVVLKPPDSCHNEPGSDCGKNMHGSRFAKMREMRNRDQDCSWLHNTASHVALAHLPFMLQSTCKLSHNPRYLTMSCHRVPKHGTEKKKVSSLEPCHFSVQARLLVSYLLNPLIVI